MRLYILLKINKVEKITKTYLEGIKVLIEEEEEKKKKKARSNLEGTREIC